MVKRLTPEIAEAVVNGAFLHCRDIHDNTCEFEAIERFFMVMKASWKFYLPIHLIPVLIFKFRLLKKGDKKVIWAQIK